MVTVYDVPPEKLIAKAAAQLKQMDTIKVPEWAEFAKTGRHTEKAPSRMTGGTLGQPRYLGRFTLRDPSAPPG